MFIFSYLTFLLERLWYPPVTGRFRLHLYEWVFRINQRVTVINRVGSMMTLFFTDEAQVTSLDEAMKSDTGKYADYFKMTLESGIYIAPSQFESLFVSYAHTDKDIDTAIAANLLALYQLR